MVLSENPLQFDKDPNKVEDTIMCFHFSLHSPLELRPSRAAATNQIQLIELYK